MFNEETGNYYYSARYYDPKWSIFISVDPLAEKTMSSYGYCYNNPINYVDPTGMEGEDWVKDGNKWIWRSDITSKQEALDKGYSDYSDGVTNNTYKSADGDEITLGKNQYWYKDGQRHKAPDGTPFSNKVSKVWGEVSGGSQVLETHNQAMELSKNSDGSTNWAGYSAHTLWLDKINNYGGDMGSAATPTLNRASRSINWSGRSFSQYKKAYWATHIKPEMEVIRLPSGKTFNVYMELHHRFIPQRARWAPNWMLNNSLNLKPLNTIRHGMQDSYRYKFFPIELKEQIRSGNTYGF